MYLSSTTELDTAKVADFPSAQLTLTPCESRRMPMRFALRKPAEPCDSVIPNPHDAEAPSVILFRGQETHPRSILKAISWRTLGTLDTFAISWFMTGKAQIAGSIAALEVITKVAWYYLHERVWAAIAWGRR
jgi:uncharacterized membrane protein